VMRQKHHYQVFSYDEELLVSPMTKQSKVLVFRNLMRQKKLNEEHLSHPIFDIVDYTYFAKMVSQYDGLASLDRLLSEYQSNQGSKYKNKFGAKSLYCQELLSKVSPEYEKEINLIYFLTLLPAGISKAMLPFLSANYYEWFGDKFKALDNPEVNTYTDFVETIQYQHNLVIRIEESYRKPLELLLEDTVFNHVHTKDDLIDLAISIMSDQARGLLKQVKKRFVGYHLVTAHLDAGIWHSKYKEQP
jgi:hypothetical protein